MTMQQQNQETLTEFFTKAKPEEMDPSNFEKAQAYLSYLTEKFGVEIAVQIFSQSQEKLLQAEGFLNNSHFDDIPEELSQEKMQQVLKILEWNIDNLEHMRTNELKAVAETFSAFDKIVHRLPEEKRFMSDESIRSHSLLENITNATQNLLNYYGAPVTDENEDGGHRGKTEDGEERILKGVTIDDVISFFLEHKEKNGTFSLYNIKGFDDPLAALEVAVRNENHWDIKDVYKNLGFTSQKDIQEVSPEDLGKLTKGFSLGGNNRGTEKRFNALMHNAVAGKRENLEEMLAVADKPNAGKYLYVFGGRKNTLRILTEVSDEERPSPEALAYAREIFGANKYEQVLKYARQIDSPLIKSRSSWTLANIKEGEVEYDNFDELVQLTDDYNTVNQKYKDSTGKEENLSKNGYQLLSKFNGDWRFLEIVGDDLTNGHYGNSLDHVQVISEIMTYDEYISLGCRNPSQLVELLKNGFSKEDIQKIYNIPNLNLYKVEYLKEGLSDSSLEEILDIVKTDVGVAYALGILKEIDFKQEGLPFELLPGLENRNATAQQIHAFQSVACGFNNYFFDESFVNFLKDFDAFISSSNSVE